MTDRNERTERRGPSLRHGLYALAGGLGALGAYCAIDSFFGEPDRLEVTDHPLEIPDLPEHLEGFTFAHLTDLHFGRTRGAHRKALATIERRQPDLVVCTGDFVEGPETFPAFETFLDRLCESARSVVAVPGNWEYKNSADFTRRALDAYRNREITLLQNESVVTDAGVAIVGGDDPVTDRFDPTRAFSDIPAAPVRLFLVHSPIAFDGDYPSAATFDLSLAGHTHGGQFRLGSLAPVTPRGSGRFTSGYYDTPVGPGYVSRGIGMTLIRGRFMCQPELPYFTLTSNDS